MDRASIREEISKGMNKIRGLPENKDEENSQKNNNLKMTMLQPNPVKIVRVDPILKRPT